MVQANHIHFILERAIFNFIEFKFTRDNLSQWTEILKIFTRYLRNFR